MAANAGIYVVFDEINRTAWVGQSLNVSARVLSHIAAGVGSKSRLLEPVDTWDQHHVSQLEIGWMLKLEYDGWTLLNKSRQANNWGGASAARESLTHDQRLQQGRTAAAQYHSVYATEHPDTYRLNQSAAGLAGGKIGAKNLSAEARSRGGKTAGASVTARKRTCSCGVTSHPPGIGTHQKSSGHVGWTDVELVTSDGR